MIKINARTHSSNKLPKITRPAMYPPYLQSAVAVTPALLCFFTAVASHGHNVAYPLLEKAGAWLFMSLSASAYEYTGLLSRLFTLLCVSMPHFTAEMVLSVGTVGAILEKCSEHCAQGSSTASDSINVRRAAAFSGVGVYVRVMLWIAVQNGGPNVAAGSFVNSGSITAATSSAASMGGVVITGALY